MRKTTEDMHPIRQRADQSESVPFRQGKQIGQAQSVRLIGLTFASGPAGPAAPPRQQRLSLQRLKRRQVQLQLVGRHGDTRRLGRVAHYPTIREIGPRGQSLQSPGRRLPQSQTMNPSSCIPISFPTTYYTCILYNSNDGGIGVAVQPLQVRSLATSPSQSQRQQVERLLDQHGELL
jgi:hypothetical protein